MLQLTYYWGPIYFSVMVTEGPVASGNRAHLVPWWCPRNKKY